MRSLLQRLGGSLSAFGDVFRNPSLRRLELAFASSETGSWIATIALSVLVFKRSGAAGVGLVLFLQTLAPALAAPFTGILADRLPRKRVMIGSDLVRAVLMVAIALAAFRDAPIVLLYALLPLVSIVSTAFRPAQAAILPSLARSPEELTAANVASSTIESVSAFVGPALGGVLVAAASAGVSFAVASGTYVLSAALLLGLRAAGPAEEPEEANGENRSVRGFRGEIFAGADVIRRERSLFLLVALIAAQVVVSGALFVLLVPLAFEHLELGEEGFGRLIAALGVGGMLGAVAAVSLIGRRLSYAFGIGVLLWGAPIALLAAWQSQAGALLLLGLVGFANTLVDVSGFTLLQRAVPDEVLARVFGILQSVLYGGTALGAILTPLLIDGLGLEGALVATGLLLPVLALVTWRKLVRIDAEAPVPSEGLALLRGVPFLVPLPAPTLEHLAGALIPLAVAPGEIVFREGERGHRFYLVAEGAFEVSIDSVPFRRQTEGDFFGEIALLRDVARTATVTARTSARLLALGRDEFVGAVTGHAQSSEAADAVVVSRLSSRRAVRPLL